MMPQITTTAIQISSAFSMGSFHQIFLVGGEMAVIVVSPKCPFDMSGYYGDTGNETSSMIPHTM